MRTSGIFTLHQQTITVKSVTEPVHIIPVGDVHWGAGLCCEKAFRRHIEWGKDRPNTYYLLMGDPVEFLSTSERRALKCIELHNTTDELIVKALREKVQEFIDVVSPLMKGRTLGVINGNHYVQWPDGTTSDHTIADALGSRFLGCMSLIRLTLKMYGECQTNIDLCVHHGKGASRLLGSSLNTVQYMTETVDADLYLMGDDHKRGAMPGEKVRVVQGKNGLVLKDRTYYICRTGGFLRSMVDGKPSYNVDAARGPLPLGGIRLELWPRRVMEKRVSSFEVEIKAVV